MGKEGTDKSGAVASTSGREAAVRATHDGPNDPRHYAVEEVLRDGGSIHIRAIRPDDKSRLLEHFNRLSRKSVYLRFMGMRRSLGDEELERLTHLDFHDHVGLAATLREGGAEHFIGVGRYIRQSGAPRAELAFAVLDEHQGRGIGTLLLEHLGRVARVHGITEFEADVLGENRRMLEVFGRSGFRVRRSFESGVIHVYFPTAETEHFQQASEERARIAAARSISRMLKPHSVAVIGASRDTAKIGGAILANLIHDKFTGPIFPINPRAEEVKGHKCFPSVSAVGEAVDLAIIAVPPSAVEAAVNDCAEAGVKGIIVITSGFAEVSAEGRQLQDRLVATVRESGMRMVGPNCMGVLNTDPAISLNATFVPVDPPRGNVGMFSQSGTVGIVALDYARQRNLGISTFVSIGNRADVSSNDLIAYWAEDPQTAVIVLYLEGFGNPRRFARLAPEVARRKPIVAVKAGRSAAGTRAASSHSAALADLDVAVDALFEQAGVIRTNTLAELFDVISLLSSQPLPEGRRVGVVTNAGGGGILFADACEARNLKLPDLEARTLDELRSFLPQRAAFSNPVDMTATARAADYERTIRLVGNDPNVDAVAVIYVPPMVTRPEEIAAGIARGAGAVAQNKPLLTIFLSSEKAPATLNSGPRGVIPSYPFPEDGVIALAAAARYAQWRKRERGTPLALSPFALSAVRSVIDRVLAEGDGPVWLGPADLAVVLKAAGIEVVAAAQTSVAEAPADADRLGYPVVAKAVAKGLIHKSDFGGVIMGLKSAQEVAAATQTLAQRTEAAGSRLESVLLQREVGGDIEALVGVTSDPTFGPLIVCGTGGTRAEIFKDVAFHLHPVTAVDAGEMLARLKLSRLIDGYRGSPPGDREALIELILHLSALVEAVPELSDLDMNPVKLLPPGKGAVVLDARMRVTPIGARSGGCPSGTSVIGRG